MTKNRIDSLTSIRTEFIPEEDPFEKVRKKGPLRWIIAHIMYKSNKFYIFLSFLLGILSSILNSQLMIVIGNALDAFTIGDVTKLKYFVTIVFLLAIGTPILNLISNLLRETVAQRIERDVRYEFYTNKSFGQKPKFSRYAAYRRYNGSSHQRC